MASICLYTIFNYFYHSLSLSLSIESSSIYSWIFSMGGVIFQVPRKSDQSEDRFLFLFIEDSFILYVLLLLRLEIESCSSMNRLSVRLGKCPSERILSIFSELWSILLVLLINQLISDFAVPSFFYVDSFYPCWISQADISILDKCCILSQISLLVCSVWWLANILSDLGLSIGVKVHQFIYLFYFYLIVYICFTLLFYILLSKASFRFKKSLNPFSLLLFNLHL